MIVDLVQSVLQGKWAQVRQLLLKHWLIQVPQVFEINEDIPWDNTGVKDTLLGMWYCYHNVQMLNKDIETCF